MTERPRIRVLVVDDSAVMRRIISDALAGQADLEVAGGAANGRLAVDMVAQLRPDVVTLDVDMPEMDGIAALTEIRHNHPTLPVIMFSSLTHRGAAATMDALSKGANDYVAKPNHVTSPDASRDYIVDVLVPRIRALVEKRRGAASPASAPAAVTRAPANPSGVIDVVAIGISTGGPNALAALLPTLGDNGGVPLLIVQHMPPMFTTLLAERLDRVSSGLTVREAAEGDVLRPGTALLAPGDFHMTVARAGTSTVVQLNQDPPENSTRPSVDVLFRSLADVYGPRCLAVVMTGMGQDGLEGGRRLATAGAPIFVQDEASSVVWGMGGFVARAGLADKVLPLEELGPAILARVRGQRAPRK